MIVAAFVALACLALPGCATTIYPPPAPTAPVKIAVLDHGKHASLVVEIPGEPAMIRYSYGDWGWYALRKTGPIEATKAIFWPSLAALGRRELPGPPSADSLFRGVRVAVEDVVFIDVSAVSARDLIARLDGLYAANVATRIYNAAYDLEFVHHPDDYWAFHNSNQMVREWLTILGCGVEGQAILSNWRLGAPATK